MLRLLAFCVSIVLLLTGRLSAQVWERIIPEAQMPGVGTVDLHEVAFDHERGMVYSISKATATNGYLVAFNLSSREVRNIRTYNYPGMLNIMVHDPASRKIYAWIAGRDPLYAISDTGGTWQRVGGNDGRDFENFGSASYWNPLISGPGFFSGYGYFSTKNWVFEVDSASGPWIQKRPNQNNVEPYKRVGAQLARSGNDSILYMFSGMGNQDGNQWSSSCTLGSAWASDVGVYCWLKDLWSYNISDHSFSNILPVNHASIAQHGAFTYDIDNHAFYILGGYVPKATWPQDNPYNNKVFRMRPGLDSGFVEIFPTGMLPPARSYLGSAKYDPVGRRVIFLRDDGIWALKQDTCSFSDYDPLPDSVKFRTSSIELNAGSGYLKYRWNTGDSSESIKVTSSGVYRITVTNAAGCVATDAVVVDLTLPGIATQSQRLTAGDTVILKANTDLAFSNFFNGDRYFEMPSPGPVGTAARSFSYWLKTTDTVPMNVLVYGDASSGTSLVDLSLNLGLWYGAASGHCATNNKGVSFFSMSHSATMAQPVSDGQWHHIAYVLGENGNNAFENIKFYVDGRLVSNGANSVPNCGHNWGGWTFNTASTPMRIGATLPGMNPYTRNFRGVLDEVAIWDRVLDSMAIDRIIRYGVKNWTSGLRHLYGFEEIEGTNRLPDEQMYNDGVASGSVDNLMYTAGARSRRLRYLWSTGDTTASIRVAPNVTTEYTLQISDGIQIFTDTVLLAVSGNASFNPFVDSISQCGSVISLDAGAGFAAYLWEDGSTGRIRSTSKSGLHWVQATDAYGFTYRDSVNVHLLDATISQQDTTLCSAMPLTLRSGITGMSASAGRRTDLPDSLLAWYPFNGHLRDESGNGFDLTARSSYNFMTGRSGSPGAAMEFTSTRLDASSDLFRFGYSDRFTVSFWFIHNAGNEGRLMSTEYPEGNFRIASYGNGSYAISFGGEPYLYDTVQTGVWAHIAYVYENRTARLYRNGILIKSQYNSTTESLNYGNPFTIGMKAGTNLSPWAGAIAEMGIWRKALSERDVRGLYERNAPGKISYLWNNGSNAPLLTVTPEHTDTYWVELNDGRLTCRDSVVVTVGLTSGYDPLPDSLEACADSVQLDANLGYSSYRWSNGATSPSISVHQSGEYAVTVTSAEGCNARDTILVKLSGVRIAGPDSTVTAGTSIRLIAAATQNRSMSNSEVYALFHDFPQFLWSTGATTDTLNVVPATSTLYRVQMTYGGITCSDSIAVTVARAERVPGAPSQLSAVPGNGTVSISFMAPTDSGTSPITNYAWSVDNGSTWTLRSPASVISPLQIMGLTNGTNYQIRLRAVNAAGQGAVSDSVNVTPLTIPGAPTSLVVTPGNGTVSLSFAAPLSTGGASITNYAWSTDDGVSWTLRSPASVSSPITITGLTNGTNYRLRLRAVNAVGQGTVSDAVTATPVGASTIPLLTTITPGNRQLTIVFTPPTVASGVRITNYEYSLNNGGSWNVRQPASVSSPLQINGLTNGQAYSIRIRAITTAGRTGASTVMLSAPYTVPDFPINLVQTVGNASVSISFRPPSFDGGSVIIHYQYSLNNGPWIDRVPVSNSSPILISGLTNGVNYSVRIRAVNAAGGGVSSWPVSAIPITTPGAPQGLSALASNRSATVSFTPPVDNGGAPITHYQWSLDGGQSWTLTSLASRSTPMLMQDLVNGRSYQIRVRALNQAGVSPASNVVTVTPCTIPDFPTNIRVEPGDRSALMYFTPPIQTGGVPILNYQYSINNGQTWLTRSPASVSSPISFTGLTNGMRYALRIRAVNAAGPGLESWTFSVTPRTVPGAPTITAAQPGNGMVNLIIQAPSNTGGASLTNYEYSVDGGLQWRARWPMHAGTNLMISGLVNGLTYPVLVKAVNEAGAGAPSAIVSVRPRLSGLKPTIQASLDMDLTKSYGDLRVYPNPVTDGKIYLEMKSGVNFIATVRLLTDDGKVVSVFKDQHWKSGKTMLDLGDIRGLKTGLLQWSTDQRTMTVRILWK